MWSLQVVAFVADDPLGLLGKVKLLAEAALGVFHFRGALCPGFLERGLGEVHVCPGKVQSMSETIGHSVRCGQFDRPLSKVYARSQTTTRMPVSRSPPQNLVS